MSDTAAADVEVTEVTAVWYERNPKYWWLWLVFGVAWSLFGIGLLTYRDVAIGTLAVLIGLTFIAAGVVELVASAFVTSWKWLWIVYGVLSIAAGFMAIFWPEETLFVLGVLLAWFLVFSGIFNVIAALAGEKYDFWWLGLLLGVLEFILGAWAVGSGTVASAILLINLAGIYALFRGFHDIFLAFAVHSWGKASGKL
jgi:uncharacterized membrane protein HdeD (DUF308 family)